MKKLLLGAAVLVAAMPVSAMAAATDLSMSVGAKATVMQPITVKTNIGNDLNFGKLILTAGGGTVSTGFVKDGTTGSVTQMPGTANQGQWVLSGMPKTTVQVTTTGGALTNGTSTMQFTTTTTGNFQALNGNGANTVENSVANFAGNGEFTLSAGGRLFVTGSETSGIYTGTFQITVSYQ